MLKRILKSNIEDLQSVLLSIELTGSGVVILFLLEVLVEGVALENLLDGALP